MRFKAIALLTSFLIAGSAFAAEQAAIMDPKTSTIKWTGRKITGHHEGSLALKKGVAYLSDEEITSGNFEVDMTALVVTDIKDEEYNKKLNDHLRSDDFFSVEKHPTANFTITSAEKIAGAKAGEPNYRITGDLTIKGVTNSVSFPATVTVDKGSAQASATMKVDRTQYGIRYNSGQFFQNLGDKLIYDEFEVELNLKAAVKQ